MIRLKYIFLVFLALLFNISWGQTNKEIKLPLRFVTGYGPFDVEKSHISFSPPAGHPLTKSWEALQFIRERNILWPNILSDNSNQVIEKYGIVKYPTGLLIDPSGKIIETDVSSINLEGILIINHLLSTTPAAKQ